MKYFSVDYRSPPSGIGQIIDTNDGLPWRDEGGKYHMILVCDIHKDDKDRPQHPDYIETLYFEWGDDDYVVIDKLIDFLAEQGVTHVNDIERTSSGEGYRRRDSNGYLQLEDYRYVCRSQQD